MLETWDNYKIYFSVSIEPFWPTLYFTLFKPEYTLQYFCDIKSNKAGNVILKEMRFYQKW